MSDRRPAPKDLPSGFGIVVGLGAPLSVYEGTLRRAMSSSDFLACGCTFPIFGTVLAGLLALLGLGYPPNPALVAVAVLVLTLTYGVAGSWIRKRTAFKVVEYERGIAVARGGQVRTIPWSAIRSITRNVVLRGGSIRGGRAVGGRLEEHYEVTTNDGFHFTLSDWFANVGALANRIEDAIVAEKLGQSVDGLQAGGTLRFGSRVSLSQDGVVLEGSSLPWQAISAIDVASGRLRVVPAGARAGAGPSVPLFLVENLKLLLAVVAQVRSGTDEEPGVVRPTASGAMPPTAPPSPSSDPAAVLTVDRVVEAVAVLESGGRFRAGACPTCGTTLFVSGVPARTQPAATTIPSSEPAGVLAIEKVVEAVAALESGGTFYAGRCPNCRTSVFLSGSGAPPQQ